MLKSRLKRRSREITPYGYIKNAISVPVDISQSRLLAIAKGISKESPIVLYCQSQGCQFSDIMAVEFAKLGFSNCQYTEMVTPNGKRNQSN